MSVAIYYFAERKNQLLVEENSQINAIIQEYYSIIIIQRYWRRFLCV